MRRAALATILWIFVIAAPHSLFGADLAFQLETLEASVEALEAQHVLNRGQARSLGVKLSHASDALREADAKRVSSHLGGFESEALGLVASGRLSSKLGQALIGAAASIRVSVERLAFTVPEIKIELPQPCAANEPCVPLQFRVDPGAGKGGDGTKGAPFGTIADALAAGKQSGACGVELLLAPGSYDEGIDVPFDLRVTGEGTGVVLTGSIVNRGGWDLHLDRISLRSSPWPGAVIVDSHCDSRTELSRVEIDGASGTGVFQRRGSIRIGLTTIRGTDAVGGDPGSGTALRLVDGAKGVLGLVGIEGNASGILAEGVGTSLYAAGVLIAGNRVTPFAEEIPEGEAPQAPGVEVRGGALLLMQFGVVRDNDLYGIVIQDGSRAHVRYTTVEGTRSLPSSHPYGRFADANIVARRSTIELDSFRATRSLVGLILRDALGYGARGEISHHEIGLGLSFSALPTSDEVTTLVRCITDRTRMLYNRRNVDSTILPLPPADPPEGEPPPAPVCARVPFDCTWCGE